MFSMCLYVQSGRRNTQPFLWRRTFPLGPPFPLVSLPPDRPTLMSFSDADRANLITLAAVASYQSSRQRRESITAARCSPGAGRGVRRLLNSRRTIHPGETLTRVCSFSDTHNQPALSRQRVSSFSIDGIIMRFVAGLGQFIGRLMSTIYVYSVHEPLLHCCCLY